MQLVISGAIAGLSMPGAVGAAPTGCAHGQYPQSARFRLRKHHESPCYGVLNPARWARSGPAPLADPARPQPPPGDDKSAVWSVLGYAPGAPNLRASPPAA